jgi:hypothetical protein
MPLAQTAFDTTNPPLVITGAQILNVTPADLQNRHVVWNGNYINNYTPLQLAQAQALYQAGVFDPANATNPNFMYGPSGTGNTIQAIKTAVAQKMGVTDTAPVGTQVPNLFAIAPTPPASITQQQVSSLANSPPVNANTVPVSGGATASTLTTWLQATSIGSIPNWVLVAGAAAVAYYLFSRK